MTNFKTFLGNLVKSCDQIYGATIMGYDGITLSKFFTKELPMSPDVYEAFIAEFSPLIKSFIDKSSEMDLGKTENITATIGEVSLLFKILNRSNFLAVISSKDAYHGKIDYYSKIEVEKFNEIFAIN